MSYELDFVPLSIAILSVSDTRSEDNDISGNLLAKKIQDASHLFYEKKVVKDDKYLIRSAVSQWIASVDVNIIITTGGTGVTGRDGTPEAVVPLLDKTLEGFGEIFRLLSYQSIKTSAIQSRALAGVANGTYIFCLPGSSDACITAWEMLIKEQLDNRTIPCNLVKLIPRLLER
ncbi:MAG: molybdenum cofactor biosynthesis protein B [Methylococcaceae bacterium]|nr:MAG: molybdenum cofactor biosynthesis protein B [Methylococcaceae bacterium]